MIGKIVASKKAKSSFSRLSRYVVNATGGVDPLSWKRTADYIIDSSKNGEREKVESIRVTNCNSDDPADATLEIMAVQEKNTRSKKENFYHVVISFPEGEKPDAHQLEDIENECCKAMGLGDHQRISAVHINTDHYHIHIAINKVHPETFRNVEPYYPKYKLMEACEKLEIKHDLQRTNHGKVAGRRVSELASAMESRTGEMSFSTWVKENASEKIIQELPSVKSWEELHISLAKLNLEIKPRGAGLIVSAKGEKNSHIKASEITRDLSYNKLKQRFGEYQSAGKKVESVKPDISYRKQPLSDKGVTHDLYDEFTRLKNKTIADRNNEKKSLRESHSKYFSELNVWYKKRRDVVKKSTSLTGKEKQQRYAALKQEFKADLENRRELYAQQRKKITDDNPVMTWQAFLQKQAEGGDVIALAALRSRQAKQMRMAADILSAENADQAKSIVYKNLKPMAKRNGDMVYNVNDGGSVTDEARNVRVTQLTAGAGYLALTLANEKYSGQPLVVRGTDEFKEQIVALAAKDGLNVTFADEYMERERRRLVALQQASKGQKRDAVDYENPEKFMEDRNRLRDKISSIDYHRSWSASDAGSATFEGVRSFKNGVQVVILSKDGEKLVKQVSPSTAAKAGSWAAGQTVNLDKGGRFTNSVRARKSR